MDQVDVAETLKALSAKIDELSNVLIEKRGNISRAFIDSKTRAEETIKYKPFTCVGGAFIGGLVLGYLMSRKS